MRAFLALVAGSLAVVVAGCRGARGDVGVPDAGAATVVTPDSGERSSTEEYWAHTRQVFNVPIGHSPVRGPAGALVTIVEFSEFQCASCSRMESSLGAVLAEHGDETRLVWKNKPLPLQPAAEPAAEAALEVRAEKGDAAFWDLHDRLVARQDELMKPGGTPDIEAIVKVASDVGADAGMVRRAVAGHTRESEINDDLDLAEDLEVEGTPHFFVNGRRLEGVQSQAKLERMIDEELRRARDLLATGTPREALYQALVGSGAGPWLPKSKTLPALPADDPTLGEPKAKVSVHVWSDYQCALCGAVERIMADLRKEHGGRIRFVWHDLPLPRHRQARVVAQAAREAYKQKGERGFWAMHDRIVAAPQEPSTSDLDAFAKDLHLDAAQWRAALDGETHAAEIDADERAAHDAGITETPAFLVVGSDTSRGSFVGHIEYASKLRRVVERALDEEP
jgi:protein-disulfide isomerase